MISRFLFIFLFFCGIVSCLNNKTKDIEFNDSIANVKNAINSINPVEEIEFEINPIPGSAQDLHFIFTTKLINCHDLPSNNDSLRILGKRIALEIKQKVKDPGNYEKFDILFVTRIDNAFATKDSYVGYHYSSEEL